MAESQIKVLDAAGDEVSLDSELSGTKQVPQHGSRDGAHVTIGATTDAMATNATGTFSLIALVKRLLARLAPTTEWTSAAAAGGIVNTTSAVTIKTAAGAGVVNYVTGLQIGSDALTNATEIVVRSGAGGTVLWRIKVPAGGWIEPRSIIFATPLRGSANALLEVATLTASGGGAVYVNAQGFSA